MTRSPGFTPSAHSTLAMRHTPSWSCAKLNDQLRPRATIFSPRPSSTWRSTNGPQMLNVSGNAMRAGVVVRSTATVWGAIIALSERDVTVEVATAALQVLARSGPADFTFVDNVMAVGKRQQSAQKLFDPQGGHTPRPQARQGGPELVPP